MSLIRKSELKQMNEEQIKNRIEGMNKELMKLNAQRYSGTLPENPGKIRQIKKTIAKLLSIKNQIKNQKEDKLEKN